jgi:hypothetical protein
MPSTPSNPTSPDSTKPSPTDLHGSTRSRSEEPPTQGVVSTFRRYRSFGKRTRSLVPGYTECYRPQRGTPCSTGVWEGTSPCNMAETSNGWTASPYLAIRNGPRVGATTLRRTGHCRHQPTGSHRSAGVRIRLGGRRRRTGLSGYHGYRCTYSRKHHRRGPPPQAP